MYDTIIIGGGPAGMAAAIQAKRDGLDFIALEKGGLGGQAVAANWIENYPGFSDLSGKDLMKIFEKQLKEKEIEFKKTKVHGISFKKDGFEISTDVETYQTKTVIVATGQVPKKINIFGDDKIAKRLFYCVDPELVDCNNKRVVIIGGGDAAFDQAISFSSMAKSVQIVMRGDKAKCLPRLKEKAVLLGIDIVEGVNLQIIEWNGSEIVMNSQHTEITADFVVGAVGKEVDAGILSALKMDENDVKPGGSDKYPGLYFAGDICRGRNRHIAIAVGDGVGCVCDIARILRK